MWEAYRLSIAQGTPKCRIVCGKFHVMQHADEAIDEVRRAGFFRKGGRMRGLVKGKRWLLLSRRVNLSVRQRRQLNQLFAFTRKVFKAYILASLGAVPKAGPDAAGPTGWDPELLPDQGASRSG